MAFSQNNFVGMSAKEFDANEKQIRTAVRLLRADSKLHNKFQHLAVYEKRSGELLAEVLWTAFGPVVVYKTQVGAWANHKPGAPGQGVTMHLRQHRKSRSIAPLTGASDQMFTVMSRSNASYEVTGGALVRALSGEGAPTDTPLVFKRVTAV